MMYAKVDICKNEWLELVFANRNKEYGAYSIRKEYAHTLNYVMAFTFLSVMSILMIWGMALKYTISTTETLQATVIDLQKYESTTTIPDEPSASKKKNAVNRAVTTQLPFAPVFTDNLVIANAPATVVNGPIGNEEIIAQDINIDLSSAGGNGGETATKEDIIYAMNSGIEVKPQPDGGEAAWRTFMQKNLRYPPEAAAENKRGTVTMSFVVEKDGRLSNIIIEKAAGYCMDEEAYRVLKLAKAWKPGYKDGQPVRVKCPLTLSFIVGR